MRIKYHDNDKKHLCVPAKIKSLAQEFVKIWNSDQVYFHEAVHILEAWQGKRSDK